MLTGRQIHGLRVVDVSRQKELGRIIDIIADSASGRIGGYVVAGNRLLAKNYFLPSEALLGLDLNGAVTTGLQAFLPLSAAYGGERQLKRRGQRLHGSDGRDQGIVADLMVEEGYIRGVELSQGVWGDLKYRRRFLPWSGLNQQALNSGDDEQNGYGGADG